MSISQQCCCLPFSIVLSLYLIDHLCQSVIIVFVCVPLMPLPVLSSAIIITIVMIMIILFCILLSHLCLIFRSESPTKSSNLSSPSAVEPVRMTSLLHPATFPESTNNTLVTVLDSEPVRPYASVTRGRQGAPRGRGGRLYSGESSSASHFTPLRNPHVGIGIERSQQKGFGGSKASSDHETSLSVGGIRTAGFAVTAEKKQNGGSAVGGGSLRLTPQHSDCRPVKVVDDVMHWDDRAADVRTCIVV